MTRNLIEYPVNAQDVEQALERASVRVEEEIGGLDGYIYSRIQDYLAAHPSALQEIVESMKIELPPR